eukprot:g1662.t1
MGAICATQKTAPAESDVDVTSTTTSSSAKNPDKVPENARKSFLQSNESWVHGQTKAKADFLKKIDGMAITEEEESTKAVEEDDSNDADISDMNDERFRLGEQQLLQQHDHELLGESEDLCKENKDWNDPHHKIAKSESDTAMILECLSKHFLFSTLARSALQTIVDEMETEQLNKDDILFHEKHNDKFYIIKSGRVKWEAQNGDVKIYPTPNGDRGFGDMALMVDLSADLEGKTTVIDPDTTVFTLHRLQFHRIAIEETRREAARLLSILKKVNLFRRKLDGAQMADVADHLITVNFKDGATIVKEGDIGKNFYILETGEVTMHKGRDPEPLATLEPGSFFGEQALLSEKPRKATFLAKGDVKCLVLGRDQFKDMFGHMRARFHSVHRKREDEIETKALSKLEKLNAEDLDYIQVIGKGSFGLVFLAKRKAANADAPPLAVKQIEKVCLVETGQQFNVVREKELMQRMSHPHIAKLWSSYSDSDSVYFVVEYLAGGHVYHWLWKSKLKFSLERTRIYAACVADSLIYMHSLNILYRDLKLENLCLDHKGVVKLIDFGLSKEVTGRTFTTAGTPEYMAPEMIQGRGHHKGVDYWALGIAIFEMLCGFTTFGMWVNKQPPTDMLVFRRVNGSKPKFPKKFDADAKEIVRGFLNKRQNERLGCKKCDGIGIREMAFFKTVDWAAIRDGKQEMPFKPPCKNINDRSCHMKSLDEKWHDHVPDRYTPSGRRYEALWSQHFPLE